MIIYYDKQTMKQTQTQSDDTIPMTDELMADYRHYASNLNDKSLELIQEVGEIPYLVKYKLDEDGNRYSHYLDEVDEDGYKLPDLEAIAADEAKLLEQQAKADRAASMLTGAVYTLNNTDYQVSFTKDDGDGMVQVKNAFDMGATGTTIHFKSGAKVPVTSEDFTAFALWFITERNKFFTE